jgi:hypothetical protein
MTDRSKSEENSVSPNITYGGFHVTNKSVLCGG